MTSMSRFFFVLLFWTWAASAQPQPPLAGDPPNAGMRIAEHGTEKGVPACITCHGSHGEGKASGGFPRLAGLPEAYMVKQLQNYASGARANPVMAPIAKALTETEKEQVSSYYAGMKIPAPPAARPKASKALLQLGEKLARVGDAKIQLQACNNCHGPGGTGEAPLIPSLAGQHASYIETQLQAWKKGERKDSPLQMSQIAQRLDEKSIKAVAAYFQQVRTR